LIISSDPLVKSCFMFGRSRTQVGIAIEPYQPIDLSSPSSIATFRNAIWSSIQQANSFAPQHSRILKDFVLVTDPVNRPLPRTPKGSVRREIAYEMYREDIERIYGEAEVGLFSMDVGEAWMRPPELGKDGKWDEKGVREFVKRVVQGVVGEKKKVDPKRDLFKQGCDSLQATYIYQVILSALVQYASSPEAKLSVNITSRIPNNFVYEHNTQEDIEDFLLKLIQNEKGDAAQREHRRRAKVEAMRDMVRKYTVEWSTPQNSRPIPTLLDNVATTKQVVLLTGTTGSLGTYLLARLLQDSRVSKVYALNRTSDKRLVERQREAFKDRGIDDCLLEREKLVLLEGNTAEAKLGLEESVYDELLMTLTSYESQVKGVRNLVDLALTSRLPTEIRPQLVFTSSVATVSGWASKKRAGTGKGARP
ncbi:hypothetical protein K435DRAFT_796770, partial [Dendrothele bispora CBS 962.96]